VQQNETALGIVNLRYYRRRSFLFFDKVPIFFFQKLFF